MSAKIFQKSAFLPKNRFFKMGHRALNWSFRANLTAKFKFGGQLESSPPISKFLRAYPRIFFEKISFLGPYTWLSTTGTYSGHSKYGSNPCFHATGTRSGQRKATGTPVGVLPENTVVHIYNSLEFVMFKVGLTRLYILHGENSGLSRQTSDVQMHISHINIFLLFFLCGIGDWLISDIWLHLF